MVLELLGSCVRYRTGGKLIDVEPNAADDYREEASRLRRKAETVTSDSVRDQLLEIAQQYDLLADSVELIGRRFSL